MSNILEKASPRVTLPVQSEDDGICKPHRTFDLLCRHLSSWFVALFKQKQVVESDDNVGKVCELHKVWSDDVDPVCAWPLGFNPGHDGWEVPRVTEHERDAQSQTHTHIHKQYHQHPDILQDIWATSRTKPGSQCLLNDISSEVWN